jgi:hypothetical protein
MNNEQLIINNSCLPQVEIIGVISDNGFCVLASL